MVAHPNRRVRKAAPSSAPAVDEIHDHDHDYRLLLSAVRSTFTFQSEYPLLFLTDAKGLYDLYLDSLPGERQVHNCHACRRFIDTYGSLVVIKHLGEAVPVMWNPAAAPDFYTSTVTALRDRVKRARVTSVFLTKAPVWGTPETGSWQHLAVVPPPGLIFHEKLLTAGQQMAAVKENFGTVSRALFEFDASLIDQAIRIFEGEAVARSEKFVAPARWLRALHDRPKGKLGENVLWRAVATAPEGYCHPKASVLGPLLDDIAAGHDFETIKAKFNAKMNPLQYQRPTAAPASGNIRAAEAIMEKLGVAESLNRRFARLEEIQTVWMPRTQRQPASTGGVFSHVKAKDSVPDPAPVGPPSKIMTWQKFMTTVLPKAEAIEIRVPLAGRFMAFLTANDPSAPPIIKWDREDERNPVSWYVYPGGSSAGSWGLHGNAWTRLTAIAPLPTMWGSKPMKFAGEGYLLVIEGAVDSNDRSGNALFPEQLKQELHGVRATIEAYSRTAKIAGRTLATACGYDVRKAERQSDCHLRVFDGGAWSAYQIDRWD